MYIASGERYLNEVCSSASSVRQHMPNTNISIVTDDTSLESELFDKIIDLPTEYKSYGISTITPNLSPYDKTLFLDTDTYLTEPVGELFDLLDDHHMAFSLSPSSKSVKGVPDPWVEFNTGVICYKNCKKTNEFLTNWNDLYQTMDYTVNQPSFTKAVYESSIRYFVLPTEYNCRIPRYGYLAKDAKIVHGRCSKSIKEVAENLNKHSGRRVHWPHINWRLQVMQKVKSDSRSYKFKKMLSGMVNDVLR